MPKKLKLTGLKVYVNALVMIRKGQVATFSPEVEEKILELGRYNAEKDFVPYFAEVHPDTPVDFDLTSQNLVPELQVYQPEPVQPQRLAPKYTPPAGATKPVQRRRPTAAV
jgi:hypothetical protein